MEFILRESEIPADLIEFFEPIDPAARRDVLTVATQPFSGAHFATFPPALVEPCILAGTSEWGCCPVCGAPWERIVERETNWQERKAAGGDTGSKEVGHSASHGNGMSHDLGGGIVHHLGWRPTCQHNLDPVPCTVLDPFSGSGTTGRVAVKHRRRYVGIELKAEYIDLARWDNTAMVLSLAMAP